jgi:hypothetical protein
MREEALFSVLYECKFPDEDEIDANGFRQLLTGEMLEEAFADSGRVETKGIILGADIGAGSDESVFCLRNDKIAWIESKIKTRDTMSCVTEIERIMTRYKVKAEDVYIDDIGVGRGVTDRLREKGLSVNGVSVGEKPFDEQEKSRYFNIKAQSYSHLANWIKAGGKLIKHGKEGWDQLTWIKYKINSDRTIQIERKEELKKRVNRSPDTADALMLTFSQVEKEEPYFNNYKKDPERRLRRSYL